MYYHFPIFPISVIKIITDLDVQLYNLRRILTAIGKRDLFSRVVLFNFQIILTKKFPEKDEEK